MVNGAHFDRVEEIHGVSHRDQDLTELQVRVFENLVGELTIGWIRWHTLLSSIMLLHL